MQDVTINNSTIVRFKQFKGLSKEEIEATFNPTFTELVFAINEIVMANEFMS